MSRFRWNVLSLWVALAWAGPTFAAEELKQLLDRLLTAPTIETTLGFTAKVLVPLFAFSQPKVGEKGGMENSVIQRINPRANYRGSVIGDAY